ncbi:MAG: ComF family protein [Thermoleophilaceae bacterium]|jgi:ComF family protein
MRVPVSSGGLRDLADLGRLITAVVAPPVCTSCGAEAAAEPLCGQCRGALRWLAPEPARATGVEAWAPLAYDGPARAMVSALKFRGAAGLSRTMAAQIAAVAPPGWLEDGVLVPVPLHAARLRRRGFNQAELLAASLADRTGLGLSDCLERRGRGTTQVGRGRAERAEAIEGAVTARPGTLVPVRAMVVDDVVTTGATLAACTRALRAAGARSVRAVAYARTPGR